MGYPIILSLILVPGKIFKGGGNDWAPTLGLGLVCRSPVTPGTLFDACGQNMLNSPIDLLSATPGRGSLACATLS